MTAERTLEILAAIQRAGIEGLIEANVSDEELIQAFDGPSEMTCAECYQSGRRDERLETRRRGISTEVKLAAMINHAELCVKCGDCEEIEAIAQG